MTSPVYISGPMSGLPEYNYPLFNQVAAILRDLGYEVVNPAEQPQVTTWEDYMRQDIKLLMDCNSMVLLDGAHASKGAMLEMQIAGAVGIKIVPFRQVEMRQVA